MFLMLLRGIAIAAPGVQSLSDGLAEQLKLAQDLPFSHLRPCGRFQQQQDV